MLEDWGLGFALRSDVERQSREHFPMPSDASVNRWVRLIPWRYGSESSQAEKETENVIL